jgi:hypothetical protein
VGQGRRGIYATVKITLQYASGILQARQWRLWECACMIELEVSTMAGQV